jgi:hypothetical protein
MNAQLEKQQYRAVVCFCCRQPIPLPAIVLHIESAEKDCQSGYATEQSGRVFHLRCRACDKEMPYRATDIVDIEGTPKPRVSRSAKNLNHPHKLTRAANA